ncbi:Na+/H+ antiporter NhaA [Phycicoccus sp. SLBN-51]|uniref:Na+/H+ antiporter NhaA n=1 Tax=Phycicoccus sp. SLBN-51 TaxID=2768447 RepID=UPI00114D94A7|nr:Na+/H+ antiporter NhaA [Phycicoccus sp. SLBN-51]TQJ49246.1 sodium/proton antiporter (NhaA family) [Phycicoccus sp. SLBN-51]
MTHPPLRPRILRRPSWAEAQRVAAALRTETVGGALLLAAAVAALLWANSPWREGYAALRDFSFGPHALHLDLSLGQWAADGLLAIFFFVAGLELKREFLVGDLRDPAKAAVPVVAALCGVAVPAALFTAVVLGLGPSGDALRGWAIPTATDIAFALAVLAVIGAHLPASLRSFLLTLAVVDDLVAITIIAIFYTSSLDLPALALALVPLAVFTFLVQRRFTQWWLLLPLAAATWALVHASGIHATVAGVLLGLTVPVRPRESVPRLSTLSAGVDVAQRFEHRLRPLSAGVAVPVFAFFAAGVTVVGGGLGATFADEVALGIMAGLVAGKLVGVFGGTWLVTRFTRAELDEDLSWWDVLGLSLLAGIGFTVSLLVGELAFGTGSERDDHVKLAVLMGSVLAALLASVVLRTRNRVYRRIALEESEDADHDGIPDVFQRSDVDTPGRG